MPLVSQAQRKWAHSPAGLKALGGEKKVAEWESETPSQLPARKTKKKINHNLREADFISHAKRK